MAQMEGKNDADTEIKSTDPELVISTYYSKMADVLGEDATHSCQIRWISHRGERRSNGDVLADF